MGILGDAFRSGRNDSRASAKAAAKAAARAATRANIRGNPHGTGGRTGRINAWPRCRAPRCWRRIHPGSVHRHCRRAWAYGVVRLPDSHPSPCCPGECPWCRRCYDTVPPPPGVEACPGRCDECGLCLDRCNGHDEKKENE